MALSPVNVRVLGSAAVVASPALWLALVDGTLPLDLALTRFLVAVGLSWVALNLVAEFFLPPATSGMPAPDGTGLAEAHRAVTGPGSGYPAPYEPAPYEPAPYEPAPYEPAPYEPMPGTTQHDAPYGSAPR